MMMSPENLNYAHTASQPRDIPPAGLASLEADATSHTLGWVGLQAVRYRDLATNEIQVPALSQHLLMLQTKPPPEMLFRSEEIKGTYRHPLARLP